MNKYIAVAFAFLGIWFYEASGGSDFEAGDNGLVVFATPQVMPPAAKPSIVARADTGMTDITRASVLTPSAPASDDVTSGLSLVTMTAQQEEPVLVAPVAVVEPVAVVAPVPAPTPEQAPEPIRDLRFVDGDRVNLRGGPGTDYAVVGRLFRDDMVEVIEDEGDGWLHLRVTATGEEGWMADWLLTAAN